MNGALRKACLFYILVMASASIYTAQVHHIIVAQCQECILLINIIQEISSYNTQFDALFGFLMNKTIVRLKHYV